MDSKRLGFLENQVVQFAAACLLADKAVVAAADSKPELVDPSELAACSFVVAVERLYTAALAVVVEQVACTLQLVELALVLFALVDFDIARMLVELEAAIEASVADMPAAVVIGVDLVAVDDFELLDAGLVVELVAA